MTPEERETNRRVLIVFAIIAVAALIYGCIYLMIGHSPI